MGETYKRRHGVDWSVDMHDVFIDLTVAKKWREYKREYGIEFRDPWVPLLDAARTLIPEQYFKVSPWTEEHFHDWVMAEKGCITWGAASTGKALLPDEPVYYRDHVGRIGDVRPGDMVFAATGSLVRVRGVYRQLDMPLYRVKFMDGTETICAKDHLWTVRYWGRLRWEGPRKTRKGVRGYITKTMPVDRIASWSNLRRRRPFVPLTEPVQFASRPVPLDPYVVGVLIGDGSLTGTVTLASHPKDSELRDEFNRRLSECCPGYGLVPVKGTEDDYMVVNLKGRRFKNPVNRALRQLGIYGRTSENKFVPDCYKLNSVEVRLDLLAGLFDTDGTVEKDGHASFTTTSHRLAEDVKFMLDSVGASATVTEKHPVAVTEGGRRPGLAAYSVYVRATGVDLARRLFKLSRKRDRLKSSGRGVGWKGIESVEPVEDRDLYPRETVCITIEDRDERGAPTNGLFPVGNFTVTHNSNDYGLLMLLDWITDPYDTVIRLGSTDKQSLKSRSWNAVVTYFTAIKAWSKATKIPVPGKFSKAGYAILNDDADDSPGSVGEKAGIVGVAVNDSEDSGKLQGAHAAYVRLVIDELATITHHDNIRKAMQNLRIGSKDFRFFALANPASWEDESCQYCMPEGGPSAVNVDTGSWVSTRGFLVRHHDGYKSIALESPEKAKEFPFLITQADIDANLEDCDGNEDAPVFWQMVRGFPPPTGVGIPTVLDASVARDQRVEDPPPPGTRVVACAAGIDPAWTEGGDGACYSLCKIRAAGEGSYPILDFSDLYKLQIKASSEAPVLLQLREQVRALMNDPGKFTAPLYATAVDASGNQNLADELDIFIGGNGAVCCLHVNNSERASELPIRAASKVRGCEKYRDRAAEAWCVLADFCKAGMVRGLPKEVVRALTKRRFYARKGSVVPVTPLRLEEKKEFKQRFRRSPDEADAAANAALAVKEVLGILPYGWLPSSQPLVDQPSQPYLATPLPASPVLAEGRSGYDGVDDLG